MLVEKIKELCSARNITIKELERNIGFGNGTMRRWNESSPALDKVIKVANYFGVSVDVLLADNEKENAPAQIASERDNEILENCKDLSNDEMAKVFAYIEGLKANRK